MNSKKELLKDKATVAVIKEFYGQAQFPYVHPWLKDLVKNGPNNEKAGFVYVYARTNDIKQ